MTNQIETLMALAGKWVRAKMAGNGGYPEQDALRTALEDVLKPGELNKDKARKVAQCAFAIFPHVNGKFPAEQALNELVGYTATPAQTPPPRLTEGQLGSEWTPCVKLPITVHVRNQRADEKHISTREGITPVRPDDLIMRGVAGEEYPIGRELFERTYRIGAAPPRREPKQDNGVTNYD